MSADRGILAIPPREFWREVPCGHPPDPVAWHGHPDAAFICHCGRLLEERDGFEIEGAPGLVVQCSKCGCHVALVAMTGEQAP